MRNEDIVLNVENFYLNSIYPKCPKQINCKGSCETYSKKPKMCYIGREYGNLEEIPNLVFLSLDCGLEHENLHTIEEVRISVEKSPPQFKPGKDKVKHWYQTFDLASIILSPLCLSR